MITECQIVDQTVRIRVKQPTPPQDCDVAVLVVSYLFAIFVTEKDWLDGKVGGRCSDSRALGTNSIRKSEVQICRRYEGQWIEERGIGDIRQRDWRYNPRIGAKRIEPCRFRIRGFFQSTCLIINIVIPATEATLARDIPTHG